MLSTSRKRIVLFPQPVFNLIDENASGSVIETNVRAIISSPQRNGKRQLSVYGELFGQPSATIFIPVSRETARGILHQARWHGIPARVRSCAVRSDADGLQNRPSGRS